MVKRERYTPGDVGPTPSDWDAPFLKDVSSLITNGFVGTATPHYTGPDGIKYLYGTNVRENSIDLKNIRFITRNFHHQESKTELREGDLLTVQSGHIGTTAVVPKELDGANCHALIVMRLLKNKVNPYFLSYYMNSHIGRARMRGLEVGSTIYHINTKDLKKFRVILPPLTEQQKIAQIISAWDKAIEKLEALIAAKQKRKKALMQQLLTGKQRFPEFEGEWKEYKLADVVDKNKKWSFTGGPFGSNLKAQDYAENGVRIIQLQNIGDGRFLDNYKIYTSDKKADALLSCNIYPGEIIISKMGDPVARACFIPDSSKRFLMASDGIRLSVNEDEFNKKFILDSINFKIFRKKAIEASNGSTRQRIGLDNLRNLTLLAPELTEQTAIANLFQAADNEIATHQKQLAALKQQKTGLMQQLLTGKKRVNVTQVAA